MQYLQCANHAQMQAAGMCTYCGKPFCKDCLVELRGRMVCRDDLDNVFEEATKAAVHTVSATPVINITNTNNNTGSYALGVSPKSRVTAILLCFFVGYIGVHRFYLGKVGTGVLWFFTGGLFGIGVIVDFLTLLFGGGSDSLGRPLS